ncbi:hypothetical protein EVAR_72916_1 [Eumeta japonica]|uniref:Uncharacterized protein n=1 Tax=Eumeta variegata TaxID=151549 RepID=A0A4C1T0U3_EUMVA|nr:hypothetical protein EVAR_72916_1 [Eumeta japonica]
MKKKIYLQADEGSTIAGSGIHRHQKIKLEITHDIIMVPMAKPEAKAVANNTDETLAPTPAPAAAPQTIKT